MDSNIALVRSMCIKSATSAVTINNRLIQLFGQSSVDLNTPQTWKYYLNISGQYHGTDEMMTVTSLDTLEEINFTKENLVNHTATQAAYGTFNSRYFYSLLDRYPDQVQLIQGILSYADINEAVAAADGTILSYPTALVEPQEQTLIMDLQGFIQRHLVRWNVQAYGLTDSLYNVSYHAQLYLTLLPKLLNLRLYRCKTNEAHSFHIRQYLASHNGLDRFLPFMTLKQALFFYRNILYLNNNVGKSETFDTLVQKVLTDRQIPIAEYSVRHLNNFDENYYANIRAKRKPINSQFNVAEKSYITIDELFDKEDRIVSGNVKYHVNRQRAIKRQLKNTKSSIIQTKDLESNMVDYNDAVPDPLEVVLMRQWAYMSVYDMYNVVVTFKDPKTSEFRSMLTKDALIYFTYILTKSLNVQTPTIPSILIEKFRIPTKPTLSKMLGVIDSKYTTARASVTAIWVRQVQITPKFSTKAFYDLSTLLYDECLKQWFSVSNTHDMNERGALSNSILQLYSDVKVKLDHADTLYVDWLTANNLPEYDYNYGQAQDLMGSIFNASTGLTVDSTKMLKNIQQKMLELLGALSSYTIQLIREINDSKIRPLNWAAIRSSKDTVDAYSDVWIETNVRVLASKGSAVDTGSIDSTFIETTKVSCSAEQDIYVPINSTTTSEYSWDIAVKVPMSPFYIHGDYLGHDPLATSSVGFICSELFLGLTDDQKNSLKSIYN